MLAFAVNNLRGVVVYASSPFVVLCMSPTIRVPPAFEHPHAGLPAPRLLLVAYSLSRKWRPYYGYSVSLPLFVASNVDGNWSAPEDRRRRDELTKPDPLSNTLLLSSGIVLFAALVTLMVLAVVHAASAFSTTLPSATYSLLPICCQSDSPY